MDCWSVLSMDWSGSAFECWSSSVFLYYFHLLVFCARKDLTCLLKTDCFSIWSIVEYIEEFGSVFPHFTLFGDELFLRSLTYLLSFFLSFSFSPSSFWLSLDCRKIKDIGERCFAWSCLFIHLPKFVPYQRVNSCSVFRLVCFPFFLPFSLSCFVLFSLTVFLVVVCFGFYIYLALHDLFFFFSRFNFYSSFCWYEWYEKIRIRCGWRSLFCCWKFNIFKRISDIRFEFVRSSAWKRDF